MATTSEAPSSKPPLELVCTVCSELFNTPKILPCGHLACRRCLMVCLESPPAECRICQPATTITGEEDDGKANSTVERMVDGFPTDLTVARLVEAHRAMSKAHVCTMCRDEAAEALCLDCWDLFCGSCRVKHTRQRVARSHALQELSTLTTETFLNRLLTVCQEHEESCSLYCHTHAVAVCAQCSTSSHHQCKRESLQAIKERNSAELSQLTAMLAEAVFKLDLNVEHLNKNIKETEHRKSQALDTIESMCTRLQSLIETNRKCLNDAVCQAAADVIQDLSDVKEMFLQRRNQLTTHKAVTERGCYYSKISALAEVDDKLKTRVKKVYRFTTRPVSKEVKSFTFIADPGVESRIETELSRLGNVTFKPLSSIDLLESANEFAFHPKCGAGIQLSRNNRSAQRHCTNPSDQYAIVISRDPMRQSTLYEVQITNTFRKRRSLKLGVLTSDPETFKLPRCLNQQDPNLLCLHNDGYLYEFGKEKKEDDRLKKMCGWRIGLALDPSRNLHLYLSGVDEGVVASNIPQSVYFVFDLSECCISIEAQPLTPCTWTEKTTTGIKTFQSDVRKISSTPVFFFSATKPASGTLQQQPAAGILQQKPADGSLQHKLTVGTIEQKPADGNLEPKHAAGKLEPKPAAGTQESKQAAGTLELKQAAGTLEPKPATGTLGPKPAAGTPEPKNAAGTLEPKHAADALGPKHADRTLEQNPAAGTLEPKSAAGTLEPKPAEGTLEPKHAAGTLEPKPADGTLEQNPAAGTLEPKPSAGTLEPKHAAGTLEPKTATGTLELTPAAGTLEPKQATGTLEPKHAAGTLEPKPAAGTLEPKPAAGTLQPKHAAGTLEPKPADGTLEQKPADETLVQNPSPVLVHSFVLNTNKPTSCTFT